jgi:hypothetical protein
MNPSSPHGALAGDSAQSVSPRLSPANLDRALEAGGIARSEFGDRSRLSFYTKKIPRAVFPRMGPAGESGGYPLPLGIFAIRELAENAE